MCDAHGWAGYRGDTLGLGLCMSCPTGYAPLPPLATRQHNRVQDRCTRHTARTLTNQSSTQRRHFSSSAGLAGAAALAALLPPCCLLLLPKSAARKPPLSASSLLLLLLPLLLPLSAPASISAASRLMMALLSLTCGEQGGQGRAALQPCTPQTRQPGSLACLLAVPTIPRGSATPAPLVCR